MEDELDYDDDFYDPDEDWENGTECGAWFNGRFSYYECTKAGSEECDWDCPYARQVREGTAKDQP